MHEDMQPRKRRDRKKKKQSEWDYEVQERHLLRKHPADKTGDYDNEEEDEEETNDDADKSSTTHDKKHGSTGWSTIIVFAITSTALVIVTGIVFIELKGSQQVSTPIAESRYVNILSNFVEEVNGDAEESHVDDVLLTARNVEEDDDEDGDGEDSSVESHRDESLEAVHADDAQYTSENSEKADEEDESLKDLNTGDDVLATDGHEDDSSEHLHGQQSLPDRVAVADAEEQLVDDGVYTETVFEEHVINTESLHDIEDLQQQEHALPSSPTDETETSERIEPAAEQVYPENVEEFNPTESTANTQSHVEPSPGDDNILNSEAASESQNHHQDQLETEVQHPIESPPSSVEDNGDIGGREDGFIEEIDDQASPYDDTLDITNAYDSEIARELRDAELELDQSPEKSKQMFENLLQLYPKSPRATYGKARAIDLLSERRKSNKLLDDAIEAFRSLLDLPDIPNKLLKLAGERCIDRMRFRGFIRSATKVQRKLIAAFPTDVGLRNQLAVSYLLMGENKAAKELLKQILRSNPEDGFAKVHYGFILMTDDRDYKGAIKYLGEGIATGEPGTVDGRFYFHLGDALSRVGRQQEAYSIYEKGVAKGLFLSVYQRSLYNENNLTSRPWWSPAQTTYEKELLVLQDHWDTIRDEGVSLLNEDREGFVHENEGLKDTGTWKQFELFARGEKVAANCARAPKTCKLIESIPSAASCRRGQVKFSIMLPDTHVWPHTGPTNCRLRAHLGLVIPNGVTIRVANETREWIQGKFIIFDDSFEHEVWHKGETLRLVLIVDFWHPDLTEHQKRTLTAI